MKLTNPEAESIEGIPTFTFNARPGNKIDVLLKEKLQEFSQ